MLEEDNPEISLKTQADLPGISYSNLYYEPVASSVQEMVFQQRIDEIYSACPFYCSWKITFLLRLEFGVSSLILRAYMHDLGILPWFRAAHE